MEDGNGRQVRLRNNIREEEIKSVHVRHIIKSKIVNALKKIKGVKSLGLDAIQVMFKKGGNSVVEWLTRLFSVCWERCKLPQDCQNSCLVSI